MKPSHKTNDDEIDRMLSREDEILPSSGFAASVMDAVRREAAAPPPIPFPWKRALPGLILAASALVLVVVVVAIAIAHSSLSTTAQFAIPRPSLLPSFFQPNLKGAVTWTVLALLVSLASVKLSMRLAASRA